MDVQRQHVQAVKQTRTLVRTAFDPIKVVTDYLISQFSLCATNKTCFFVTNKKRTKEDEDILVRILSEQQKRIGG